MPAVEVMYNIRFTGKFRKDVKRCASRGLNLDLLRETVDILARTGTHADLF